ncbi:MAG: 50S ribosomal protein L19 [bacterium]
MTILIDKKEKTVLSLNPGATVKIYEKIKEKSGKKGEIKERIQIFEGIVLARKHHNEQGATITVRKISNGAGVEKIFPIYSPVIEKIEVLKQAKVNKAKLYYLRNYKKKLKEVKV